MGWEMQKQIDEVSGRFLRLNLRVTPRYPENPWKPPNGRSLVGTKKIWDWLARYIAVYMVVFFAFGRTGFWTFWGV